jgi:hypothetical protein
LAGVFECILGSHCLSDLEGTGSKVLQFVGKCSNPPRHDS